MLVSVMIGSRNIFPIISQHSFYCDKPGMINLWNNKKRRAFVKVRSVFFLWMLLLLVGFGFMLTGQLNVAAAPEDTNISQAVTPTEAVMTQPIPPGVEKGANWPLVCGGVVLLVIIIGGVAWNFRIKKATEADH
jgi:hypothetical protein